MQTEIQAEAVLCPNCKEEVPKTLYCLNCGYPLYKMELEMKEPEGAAEEPISEPVVEDVLIQVDDMEIWPIVEATVEPMSLASVEPVEVFESPEPQAVEAGIEVEPDTASAPAEDQEEPDDVVEPVEVAIEVAEEPVVTQEAEPEEPVIEAPVEELAVVEEAEPEEPVIEVAVEEPVMEAAAESEPVFEPDPVIKDVMENLAKNVSMKIKLVNLLLNDEVKKETFERLFDSYVARGELLVNSRSEMLERVRFDLDSKEKALDEAMTGLDELIIRRSIGDVSEAEFDAKYPGYQWDIGKYEDDVARKRAEIEYMKDISVMFRAEELSELREQCASGLGSLGDLANAGRVAPETADRIRTVLEESAKILGGS